MWLKDLSRAVASAIRDQWIIVAFSAWLQMVAISANSAMLGLLGVPSVKSFTEPEGEGCLEVASVV